MVEIDVKCSQGDLERAVEQLELTIALDLELKSRPGCRHLHLKLGKRPGTLEVTIDPSAGRTWISYRGNRVGDGWVVEYAERLSTLVARKPLRVSRSDAIETLW